MGGEWISYKEIKKKRLKFQFMKHRIILYTLSYNESDIVEYSIDYWKRLGVDKVICYDNYSTDDTVEKLKKYDWIEVRYFKTDGMTDDLHAIIKNNCWKEQKGKENTYVVVCDFDEYLYFPSGVEATLDKMDGRFSVLGCKWFALCNDDTPERIEGVLLHEQSDKFYLQDVNRNYPELGKFMLINPNMIDDMGWSVGNHICNPTGDFKLYVAPIEECVAIHINKGFSPKYFVEKRKRMAKRLSNLNKMKGYCFEYNFPEEKSLEEYRENQKKSVNLNKILKK